jgi:succinate dehydrogenase / fumarate reductase flavoprotein subunit
MGECDYQYHGANRLGANSLLSCIFTGLFCAPGIEKGLAALKDSAGDEKYEQLLRGQRSLKQLEHDNLLKRNTGRENPYLLHQQLGDIMTKAATVVRVNDQLRDAIEKVDELAERVKSCSLSDTGNWTNQNVLFTKSLRDMFPIAKAILAGALARDECRGAHYKPAFDMPGIEPLADAAEKRRQAQTWCDAFDEKNRKWLKTTIAEFDANGDPRLSYEDVDTSLIPPRPRLYGLVGAELIEEVWKERHARQAANVANGAPARTGAPAVAAS